MKIDFKKILKTVLVLLLVFTVYYIKARIELENPVVPDEPPIQTEVLDEFGIYTTKEDVAQYLVTYNRLPDNFITKKQAESLGWTGGGLDDYAPNKCIGGDYFGNYEELLPTEKGRKYYECDIDTLNKKSRGSKRIIFSNDGYIYYTADHYETFELLYEPVE